MTTYMPTVLLVVSTIQLNMVAQSSIAAVNVETIPKAELPQKIDLTKRRISLLLTQIKIMAGKYEQSKQYMAFQRYRLMKAMVKELIADSSRY